MDYSISSSVEEEAPSLAGYVLLNLMPVLQNMFKWLNMKSLCSCLQVCKLWNKIVLKEIAKRNSVDAYLVDLLTEEERECNSRLSLLLESYMKSMSNYPKIILQMILYSNCSNSNFGKLPKDALLIIVESAGVVGRQKQKDNEGPCKEIQKNVTDDQASSNFTQSFIGFQSNEKVTIDHFIIGNESLENENPFELFGNNISSNLQKPVIVLLTSDICRRDQVKEVINCLKKKFNNPTVIGGICSSVFTFSNCKEVKDQGTVGIVLSGVKSELIIHQSKNTEKLQKKLEDMKRNMSKKLNKDIDINRSLIFMISCCERGSSYYNGKENVECDIVNKVFPGIRVSGLFSYGEIGYDSTLSSKTYLYSFTSFFCLICY